MTIYTATIYGESYRLRADFAQASCPVERETIDGNWEPTGKQVADYSHYPLRAMRDELEQSVGVCIETGNHDAAIDEVIRAMDI